MSSKPIDLHAKVPVSKLRLTPPKLRPLKLEAGKFYRSRDGEQWCCFKVDPTAVVQARAHCVQVATHRVEYFFIDGRYDQGGKREHCLVELWGP